TNVRRTTKTAEDGSYKFENLAPGTNYIITETTDPSFTIDGKDTPGSLGGTASRIAATSSTPAHDQILIASLAQASAGTNYNFGEQGRALTTVSLRDFFSSTSKNYAYVAFDNSGAELWHATTGGV